MGKSKPLYKSENVTIQQGSSADSDDCEFLLGKTISKVDAHEGALELTFFDGSSAYISGGGNEDDSWFDLQVEKVK